MYASVIRVPQDITITLSASEVQNLLAWFETRGAHFCDYDKTVCALVTELTAVCNG